MSNWEYGGTYKDFDMTGPIELEGGSIVQVCDWMKSMPEFMKRADTLFIDPPWNMGNVRTFYTKADLERPEGFDFLGLTAKLFERIDEISPHFLFIEMGKEFLDVYLSECKKRFKYVTFYNSTYYGKSENKCYVIHACNVHKRRRYKELEDMDERDIINWICRNHEYDCIGDLCMGMGLVGQNAFDAGKSFVGTELNPKRLAKLVDYVENGRTKKTA
jgi:hypothetical protein